MTSRRTAGALVAAASAAALVVVAIGPTAQAAPGVSSMHFSTTSGPPGTHVTISGDRCQGGTATVFFRDKGDPNDPTDILRSKDYTPDGDGAWSGDFAIPDGLDPAPEYFLSGQCTAADGETVINFYDFQPFDVTAAPPAEQPPAEQPPAPPSGGSGGGDTVAPTPQAGDSGVPAAQPATPVPADPTFTG
jgi:hypothetical protein